MGKQPTGSLGTEQERADDANRPLTQYRDYYYRRHLGAKELLPAIGAAVGLGLVGFYLARIFLEKTPIETPKDLPARRPLQRRRVERVLRG